MAKRRECRECGRPVEPRKRLCADCKVLARKATHRRYEDSNRHERNAVRAEAKQEAADYDQVVDYSDGGHAPPVFDNHQPPPQRRLPTLLDYEDDEISDGRVEHPDRRQEARQLDFSRVPGWVRQNQEAGRRMARDQMREKDRGDQTGPRPWEQDLMQSDCVDGYTVDFSKAAPGSPAYPYTQPSGYARNGIGQSVPRARRWR